MHNRSEKFFKGSDGNKLFLQTWDTPNAVATILITHGQAEHSDCYQRLVEGLTKYLPFNFVAWDLRGHGKSDGLRGFAVDFKDYVSDYELFIDQALSLSIIKNNPIFILGHSMGGLIQSCALIEKKYTEFAAQILSSPLFGLSIPMPIWKESASGFINKFIPKLTLSNEIKYEILTRDIDVIKEYEKDTYRHNKISTGVFIGIKREIEAIKTRGAEITIPTFLNISDHDPLISTPDALDFFNSLSSKNNVLKMVDGAKHELYNDTCRDEVFKSISEFCSQFIKKT